MMNTIFITFSIIILTSNPGSSLTCWNCTPAGSQIAGFREMATECAQESAQIPTNPKENTVLPTGLSTQVCSDSEGRITNDAACGSIRSGMMSEGKLIFVTIRQCIPGMGSLGNKCFEQEDSNAFLGKVEICVCNTDLCNGNVNISHTEQPSAKVKDFSMVLGKVDELEREVETLVDKVENVEENVKEIEETIHELKNIE